MKGLTIVFAIVPLLLLLVSCEREYYEPSDPTPTDLEDEESKYFEDYSKHMTGFEPD